MTHQALLSTHLLTVGLALVLTGACTQSPVMTMELLQALPLTESPATDLSGTPSNSPTDSPSRLGPTAGQAESWNSASVGPRGTNEQISGDLGVWGTFVGAPLTEHGVITPARGSELRISPDKQLVLFARDEVAYDSAGGMAGVFISWPTGETSGIPLTTRTVLSVRFRCDVLLANSPLGGEGVQAYIRIFSSSPNGGGFAMIYSHEDAILAGSPVPACFVVSDTINRRLYDDCAAVFGMAAWVEPMFIRDITIAVGAHASSAVNGVGVAECTCYVDDLTFTEAP